MKGRRCPFGFGNRRYTTAVLELCCNSHSCISIRLRDELLMIQTGTLKVGNTIRIVAARHMFV
jgi:hypothetical protein